MSEATEGKPVSGELPTAPKIEPTPTRHRPSGVQELGTAALAILLYLLLLDSAVETLLSGSPVRWIVVGAVVGYIALSVFVWRRFSWGPKAAVSLLVLLGLLAATAWLPEGLSHGVTLLHQPTSTVLAGVTGLAIFLAGLILVQWRFVPLPARVAIGLLAAYGLSALGLGILKGIPYGDLFHGHSLWDRLPFWLQGAFVGALVFLPLALLAQLVYGVLQIRGRRLQAWGVQALALSLSLVTAMAGFVGPGGLPPVGVSQSQAPPLQQSTSLPSPPQRGLGVSGSTSQSVKSPKLDFEDARTRMEALFEAIKRIDENIPRSEFDMEVLAERLGSSLEKAFEFVKGLDYEPYWGSLRGERGTLFARAGNSLDRSLLLAGLLKLQGHETRIARGELSREHVDTLLNRVYQFGSASGPEQQIALPKLEDLLAHAGLFGDFHSQLKLQQDLANALQQTLSSRIAHDLEAIQAKLQEAHIVLGSGAENSRAALEDEIKDHYWVQVASEKGWVDLDAAFPMAQVGQSYANVQEVIDPSNLPDDRRHRVRVALVAERLDDGQFSQRTVLDVSLPSNEMAGNTITLLFLPLGIGHLEDLGRATGFQPILFAGQQRYDGLPLGKPDQVSSPGGSLLGPLGGAPSSEREDLGALTGMWLNITVNAPNLSEQTFKREILDRVGIENRDDRGQPNTQRITDPTTIPILLARRYDILIATGPPSRAFLAHTVAAEWLQNHTAVFDALKLHYGKIDEVDPQSAFNVTRRTSIPLLSFWDALTADFPRASSTEKMRIYANRPYIVLQREGLAPNGQDLSSAYDILSSHLRVLGNPPNGAGNVRLRLGITATNLELLLSQQVESRTPVLNASHVFEAAVRQRIPIITLKGSLGDISRLDFPAAVKARIRDDIRRGNLVVIPQRTVDLGGRPATAWWRIDTENGEALGVGENGEGQSMAEQAIKTGETLAGTIWCLNRAKAKLTQKHDPQGSGMALLVCTMGGISGVLSLFKEGIILVAIASLIKLSTNLLK